MSTIAVYHVEVRGRTLPVSLTVDAGRVVARHEPTGAFGLGATADEALTDIARALAEDAAFYCRVGPRLPMVGPLAAKRTVVQRVFGCSVETRR